MTLASRDHLIEELRHARAELEYYRWCMGIQGDRLQILHDWMKPARWQKFINDHPDAFSWFDSSGVVTCPR